jgi:hypothetical protein
MLTNDENDQSYANLRYIKTHRGVMQDKRKSLLEQFDLNQPNLHQTFKFSPENTVRDISNADINFLCQSNKIA